MNTGRKDRVDRIVSNKSGASVSTSQEYIEVSYYLFASSYKHCLETRTNSSLYAYAIIPLLVSAIRSFYLELEKMASPFEPTEGVLKIAKSASDLIPIFEIVGMDESLRSDYELLQELRNEIVHPAFFPSGNSDNCPEYLRSLKKKGLFTSTNSSSDYAFSHQIASHKLCIWAAGLIENLAERIIAMRPDWAPLNSSFMMNFSKYREFSLTETLH